MGLLQVNKKISQDSMVTDSFDTCDILPRSIHQHTYITPAYTGYTSIHELYQHAQVTPAYMDRSPPTISISTKL